MMQYAGGIGQGFEVVLIYIGTERVEINLARVAKRVREFMRQNLCARREWDL